MFPFLLIFIIFCIVLSYYIKKGNESQKKVQEEFWEKERLANLTRKQDISKLDYITIPFEKIPVKLSTTTEESFFALANKPMLNLTGISNTDLKLTYGVGNLAELSEYDSNFSDMVTILPQYTEELIAAGHESVAQILLEFAVGCKADSKKIYSQLALLYHNNLQTDKLKDLFDSANTLPEYTRIAIQNELSAYLP